MYKVRKYSIMFSRGKTNENIITQNIKRYLVIPITANIKIIYV